MSRQLKAIANPSSTASSPAAPSGVLERKCACGRAPGPTDTRAERRGSRLQRGAVPEAGAEQAPPIVHQVLQSPGQPMAADTRRMMESRLGHDFGHVRVHRDARAAESAQAVDAHAYTVGRHIVLGRGPFAPGTEAGRQLLAHELTHVVQQRGAGSAPPETLTIGPVDDPREREARQVESHLTAGQTRVEGGTQRDPVPTLRRVTFAPVECRTFRGRCREGSAELRDTRQAVNLMQRTTAGAWLLRALAGNEELDNSTITMHFSTTVIRESSGIAGSFYPPRIGASAYTAYVDLAAHQALGTATPREPDSPLPAPQSVYGGDERTVPSYVVERPSLLAETLFHELLHVWYLNTFGDLGLGHPNAPKYGTEPYTGHGAHPELGHIDKPFLRRLRQFAVQVYRAETRPRPAEPQPAPTQPAEPAPTTAPSTPAPSPEPEGAGSNVSFNFGVGLGATWMPGTSTDPTAELGLESRIGFLYGRAYRFGAEANALYMPGEGIVGIGGTARFRIMQEEETLGGGSRAVSNPWFFDFEAGAAYAFRPGADADRALGTLLLSGGVGVGQQYSVGGGWSPFWRVGAALHAAPTAEMNQIGGSVGLTAGFEFLP